MKEHATRDNSFALRVVKLAKYLGSEKREFVLSRKASKRPE